MRSSRVEMGIAIAVAVAVTLDLCFFNIFPFRFGFEGYPLFAPAFARLLSDPFYSRQPMKEARLEVTSPALDGSLFERIEQKMKTIAVLYIY